MAISYQGNKNGTSYIPTVPKPIDVRTVVDSVDDLTNKSISYMYPGLVVNIKGTGDLYVLKTNALQANKIESWAKVGDIDLSNFATKDDLVDFLTASDVEDYVKADDIKDFITADALNDLASKSDLDGYVKTEDLTDYLTSSDLDDVVRVDDLKDYAKSDDIPNVSNFATKDDLVDFLTASDVEDYVKVEDIENFVSQDDIKDLASKSDLDGYVKTDDVVDYLTASDAGELFATKAELADYALTSQIPTVPTNVSVFTNDAGYLTQHQDLSAYATKAELPTEGVFPDVDGSDASDSGIGGYATIDGVIEYVNALLEKKKEDNVVYAYITGYGFNDTPTDITVFNKFSLNETGDTEIEVYAPAEISVYDPDTYDLLPSVKFTVEIPDGYSIKNAYVWNDDNDAYETIMSDHRALGTNPRHATRVIDGITYNSYCRGPVNEEAANSQEQYKIIITKQ